MYTNAYVNVDFSNVQWPTANMPTSFSRIVKCSYFLDNDGHLLPHDDIKDILIAWLYDEYNVCPTSIDFQIVP